MNKIILILFLSTCLSLNLIVAQTKDPSDLFLEFAQLYNSGDFIGAEKCMLHVLDIEEKLPPIYYIYAYNNLGLVKKSLGSYAEALSYYDKAESMILNDKSFSTDLAIIYSNKSRIYTFQKSFITAIDFLEKSIRIFKANENPTEKVLDRMSTSYLNLGIVYYESGDYENAIKNLDESLRLKLKYNLPETELTFLALAKTYAKTGNEISADVFFKRSINSMKSQFGEDYYRTAEIFFDYGLFLRSGGKLDESQFVNHKALSICRKNYGEKHPYVSLSLRNLGDFHLSLNNYDSSLYYYQRSLIAIVNGFSENNILENPLLDSVILDVDLLKTLRKKSEALELYSRVQNDSATKIRFLDTSLETIELAIHLIDRIRNEYLTEESRIYLAENEKETYISAIRISKALYDLTGDWSMVSRMYSAAAKAKAAVLRNEISENQLLWSAGIPDTLYKKQTSLSTGISAYNNLILEETRKREPDSNKISLWKDALFEMNREKERISTMINNEFPQLRELLGKTEPLPSVEVQRNLRRDETIIDYLLSNEYNKGKRNLYAFIITRDNIEFFQTGLDSLFIKSAEIIRNHSEGNNDFSEYSGALYYMYDNLVKPVEGCLSGNKLIIIPDEEIAWLPFDAFLTDLPRPDQSDYEGLSFLIRKYALSYAYSSSLIFDIPGKHGKGERVSAFAPDYSGDTLNVQVSGQLQGAGKEIESVLKLFKGDEFTGFRSTEHNFRASIRQPAIFHLAMHSVTDTIDSRYSWLAFDVKPDTIEDGRLYNYEISLMRIVSPMVVLSACNSGTGTLYHGEGLMSMARSFVLAGASSVVRTSWEVNDETSAGIIISFYHHLSKGMRKNEALQQAKLDYLEGSTPALSDPRYWAAYEVLGDNSPVTDKNTGIVILIIAAVVLTAGIAFYFRRRRIFSARSE